jgi:hypothetical protein
MRHLKRALGPSSQQPCCAAGCVPCAQRHQGACATVWRRVARLWRWPVDQLWLRILQLADDPADRSSLLGPNPVYRVSERFDQQTRQALAGVNGEGKLTPSQLLNVALLGVMVPGREGEPCEQLGLLLVRAAARISRHVLRTSCWPPRHAFAAAGATRPRCARRWKRCQISARRATARMRRRLQSVQCTCSSRRPSQTARRAVSRRARAAALCSQSWHAPCRGSCAACRISCHPRAEATACMFAWLRAPVTTRSAGESLQPPAPLTFCAHLTRFICNDASAIGVC